MTKKANVKKGGGGGESLNETLTGIVESMENYVQNKVFKPKPMEIPKETHGDTPRSTNFKSNDSLGEHTQGFRGLLSL